ncbi:MAG: GDP-mannose 4,6-dehydratase, partial [Elainella sp.]
PGQARRAALAFLSPEYVEAMYRMLQQEQPDDFVIATGQACSLQAFVEEVFSYVGLNWQDHVQIDQSLYRPTDIAVSCGDASKAKELLGWQAKYTVKEIARLMVDAA